MTEDASSIENHPAVQDLRAYIARLRADHVAQIAALEECLRTRLRVLAQKGVKPTEDTLFNAFVTGITLMKQHEEALLIAVDRATRQRPTEANSADGPVEWHSVGELRVSFDRRTDASRFIIVRDADTGRELVGKGLIDGALGPKIVRDVIPSDLAVLEAALKMLELWEQMQVRLREQKG
jgi:hypothetical protein